MKLQKKKQSESNTKKETIILWKLYLHEFTYFIHM